MAGLNTPQPLPDFLVELGGGGRLASLSNMQHISWDQKPSFSTDHPPEKVAHRRIF